MPDDTILTVPLCHEILQRLARIEEAVKTEGARCPYREDISRAKNGIEERRELSRRVDAIEDRLVDTRINVARLLATGGVGGVAGTLLIEVIKALLEMMP